MTTKTITELETELATVDAQISELSAMPSSGTVGRTTISTTGTIAALMMRRRMIMDQMIALSRASLGPARRVVI